MNQPLVVVVKKCNICGKKFTREFDRNKGQTWQQIQDYMQKRDIYCNDHKERSLFDWTA